MTFNFFLPNNRSIKNIHLSLIDKSQNKEYTFRTALRISPDEWDEQKQRPVNIYIKKQKQLNTKLDEIKKEVSEYIRNQQLKNKIPLQKELSKKIKDICINKEKQLAESSLLYYMQWYISTKEELICSSTYKRYQVFYRLLERFEGFICKRIRIDETNSDFVRNFMIFGKEEEYSESTLYRTIHFVKTILNFAERKGIRTCIRELELRKENKVRQIITLTENEIERIENTKVPKEYKEAKDWLLISCYTGQRFSDFMKFDVQKINIIKGKSCLFFIQQKTKKEMVLPLHPKVLDVINQNGGSFPPFLENNTYNEQIKQLGKYVNINNVIKARKRIGFRMKNVEVQKYELLTSHIGRRSFATNFYGKIPTPLLMEATGHSTEQMFLRYINPNNDERILALGNYFEKEYQNRIEV